MGRVSRVLACATGGVGAGERAPCLHTPVMRLPFWVLCRCSASRSAKSQRPTSSASSQIARAHQVGDAAQVEDVHELRRARHNPSKRCEPVPDKDRAAAPAAGAAPDIGPLIKAVVATNKFEKDMAAIFGGGSDQGEVKAGVMLGVYSPDSVCILWPAPAQMWCCTCGLLHEVKERGAVGMRA